MSLADPTLRVNDRAIDAAAAVDIAALRSDVEPWLSAIFQSEHLALLLGNGFTTAIAGRAGCPPVPMGMVDIRIEHADKVQLRAEQLATAARRGEPNIEDQLRAALQLEGGLDVLEDPGASQWRDAIGEALAALVTAVLETERAIHEAIAERSDEGEAAAQDLISFLLSFASRAASRERLNVFTTNYDRLVEYGCDLVGLRPLDRFVGGLAPRFRASRLEVDMHYNPPGIRGEPRYLEGVLRLTKLHGSIDWRYQDQELRRGALPFGASVADSDLAATAYESLIIYPNPAKDIETLEYPYAELFRDLSASLCRPNSALVTYGYGFGDDHINRIIVDMLAIPSTHLVAIAYEDTGGRLEAFLKRNGRQSQVSLLVGRDLAGLENLVKYFLPKPAIDTVTLRQAELLRRRAVSAAGDDTITGAAS